MGRNLPLKTRRFAARGISKRDRRAWGNRYFRLPAGRATLTTSMAGANNDLTFRANVPGTAGNSITVAIVNGGTAPVITYAGTAITITTPVGTTTATEVARAVNRSITQDAAGRDTQLVWAQRADGNDGTGFVTTLAPTALSGGKAGD
jgi:hypothetical protein